MTVGGRRVLLIVAALALTALPFALATALTGDDHVFLAFARHAPSPLAPFWSDQHGGEYYRPLPMMLWWLLGHAGAGATWPFAAAAALLHTAVAAGVGALFVATTPAARRQQALPSAVLAAALFLLAPATRDAALWYSASTDLLATAATIGSILLLLRRRSAASAAVALCAYLCKESAFALPLLAYVCVRARRRDEGRRAALVSVVPHVALAVAAAALRFIVLHGAGGAADQRAPWHVKTIQLLVGLAQEVTGFELASQPLAWVGVLVLVLGIVSMVRRMRRDDAALVPAWWMLLALLPLLAAGWPVGTRYYYLPAVGLAWLSATMLLRAPPVVLLMVVAGLVGLGLAQTVTRRAEIVQYRARVEAVRRAVADGARRGHRVFHVDGGIKDVELAVKGWRGAVPGVADDELTVLGDVPASFAYLTPVLSTRLSFLIARPPIPPAGAYRFGSATLVGLARRGDEPSLSEVTEAVPHIRFIRLRLARDGRVVWRDVTEQLTASE